MNKYENIQIKPGQECDFENYISCKKKLKKTIFLYILAFLTFVGAIILILIIGYGWKKWSFLGLTTFCLFLCVSECVTWIRRATSEINKLKTENPDFPQLYDDLKRGK